MPHARAIGVLVRSILVEREPLYRQHETVATFAPWAFGLGAEQAQGFATTRSVARSNASSMPTAARS